LDSEGKRSEEFLFFFSLVVPLTFEIKAAAYKPWIGSSTGLMHTQEDATMSPSNCPFKTHLKQESQTVLLCKHAKHCRLEMGQGIAL
jgi:hypothetical protein